MLKDRVKELLKTLQIANFELADYIGYSPSNISRLRSGKLKPAYDSASMRKFTKGVAEYASLCGKTEILQELTGDLSLLDYLYQDEDVLQNKSNTVPFSAFGEKLTAVMYMTELSNNKLANLMGVDPSMISRFRNGHRAPRKNRKVIDVLCQAIIDEVIANDQIEELTTLIEYPYGDGINPDVLYVHFQNWLCDFGSPDNAAVNDLLQSINSSALGTGEPKQSAKKSSRRKISQSKDAAQSKPPVLPVPAKPFDLSSIIPKSILSDISPMYLGIKGLQQATIRFLASAISSGAKEVLLYSDENTDWMTEDKNFRKQWAALMKGLLQSGIRIKIIHNINRNATEMIEAIKNWIPLYMTGMIDAYYCKKGNGNRFTHTLFICPEVACISSFHAANTREPLYEYHTDSQYIDYYMDVWNALHRSSETLIRLQTHYPQLTKKLTLIFPFPKGTRFCV